MRSQLMKCPSCKRYTMKATCDSCGTATAVAHPSRYSPDDKYARLRLPQAYENR